MVLVCPVKGDKLAQALAVQPIFSQWAEQVITDWILLVANGWTFGLRAMASYSRANVRLLPA
jgi:hypothetical protein